MEEKRTSRRWFRFSLRTLLLVVTLLACLAGYLRWRHVNSPEYVQRVRLAEFSQDFSAFPLQIGDWTGKNQPVNPASIDIIEPWRELRREYLNSKTSAKICLVVVRGNPIHIPDRAQTYGHSYSDFSHAEVEKRYVGLPPEVESVDTYKVQMGRHASYFKIETWSPSGVWSAPYSPRYTFWSEPEITRVSVTYTAADPKTWGSMQEFEDFFVAIFPHLQASLFSGK